MDRLKGVFYFFFFLWFFRPIKSRPRTLRASLASRYAQMTRLYYITFIRNSVRLLVVTDDTDGSLVVFSGVLMGILRSRSRDVIKATAARPDFAVRCGYPPDQVRLGYYGRNTTNCKYECRPPHPAASTSAHRPRAVRPSRRPVESRKHGPVYGNRRIDFPEDSWPADGRLIIITIITIIIIIGIIL